MTDKESYGKFIETSRQSTSQVAVPDGFTQSVMNRIDAIENSSGRKGGVRPEVILKWRLAAACISSAAAALLLFGLFSVSMSRIEGEQYTREAASPEMPVLTAEERIEIYRQASTMAEFIAELNK